MTRGLTLVKSAPREIARGQEKVNQEFVCQSKETENTDRNKLSAQQPASVHWGGTVSITRK